MKPRVIVMLLPILTAIGASAQQVPSSAGPFQFNTPYECGDGATLTAFECQRQSGQEYCFVKLEHKGRFLTQVPKPLAEIAEKVKSCKAQAPFNPPYLSQFPTTDRVILTMKTGDQRDTLVRAIHACRR